MYEYKFEKIPMNMPAFRDSEPTENYHEIVHQHAKEGWRLVQIFAPSTRNIGTAAYIELIFEREKE